MISWFYSVVPIKHTSSPILQTYKRRKRTEVVQDGVDTVQANNNVDDTYEKYIAVNLLSEKVNDLWSVKWSSQIWTIILSYIFLYWINYKFLYSIINIIIYVSVLLTLVYIFIAYHYQSNQDNVSTFGHNDLHGAHSDVNDNTFLKAKATDKGDCLDASTGHDKTSLDLEKVHEPHNCKPCSHHVF